MDITITISETTAANIQERAKGQPVEVFVEEFVEQTFTNGKSQERPHNLLKFAGMFRSGRSDTSERMSEILRETDFDPAEGFSVR